MSMATLMQYAQSRDEELLQSSKEDLQSQFSNQTLALRNHDSFSRNASHLYRRPNKTVRKQNIKKAQKENGKQWHPTFYMPRVCADSPLYRTREDHQNQDDNGSEVEVDDEERNENEDIAQDNAISTIDAPEQTQVTVGPSDEDDIMKTFLGDFEGSIPSWEAKIVRQFSAREVTESPVTRDFETWVWMDDREYPSGRSRPYPKGLDAAELRETLQQKRFGQHGLSNADRRLIYVSRLTPKIVIALAETAWGHQVDALRDAIWKHIALETSFRVHVPMDGFKSFRLEFHLAHLILRKTDTSSHPDTDGGKGVSKSLLDLSFLNLDTSAGSSSIYTLRQAHISVVVCGWSNCQWTGYAFSNTGLDEVPFQEQDENEPKPDLFAADRDDDYIKDADAPTWDARKYWLQIVAIRCELVLKEWLYLVCTIEEGVEAWKASDPCSNSTRQTTLDPKDIQHSLDWTIQTMQLLRKLRDSLSMTLRAYKRFDEPGGDKCYFSDVTDCSTTKNSIKESFEKLADLYLRLSSIDDSCKRFATHLGRILSLESNRLTAESNKLNMESNKLNAKSFDLNKESRDLNSRASALNDKMRELNERSTEAACANQAAATKTSRSTRVNIELLLFTTPFGMVLQYFGSEKDIFSFNRNPKTFVLATLVLMLVLRLLTLLLEHAEFLLKLVPWKTPVRPNEQRPVGDNQDAIELEPTHSV